jgi:hypothetical protein
LFLTWRLHGSFPPSPLPPAGPLSSGQAFARDANRVLGRTGEPFWQKESYDHWVRNRNEFEKIRAYIEMNP